ncbi:MAG: TonB-dependent receptor [Gemmatimonadales bacterium]|nr:TonB-dependent receptor [Gemmatimonadales bacterium]
MILSNYLPRIGLLTGFILAGTIQAAFLQPVPMVRAEVLTGQSLEKPVLADSTVVELPELTVSGEAAAPPVPGRSVINTASVTVRDPGSLADLGNLLPSSRVAVNSRGESTLMIRGAPERHVQTFLDGIPLNLPWDERTDLGTIPIIGGAGLEGRRGLPTLLAGPGVLAGSVRILPPRLAGAQQQTRLNTTLGDGGMKRVGLMHQRTAGQWTLLGAGSWQDREAWILPTDGSDGSVPKPARTERFNSDLSQTSLLLRASRPVAETGRVNFLATAWSAEKGVPPELHLGNDARFWRYPVRRRALLGASLTLPLGQDHNWDLSGMAALDFFEQEIDPRGPDDWNAPLAVGDEYEKDLDRSGHLQGGLTRWLGETARLSLQGNARYSHHRESLIVGGPRESYAQWLTGLVIEGEFRPRSSWRLRTGAGWDHSGTPESGNKSKAATFHEPALSLRLSREISSRSEIYTSFSRRSRFPSMRELYSGALDKFVPNPNLIPERQDLLETGLTARGTGWNLAAACFLQNLTDGIEKTKLPEEDPLHPLNQFMRVNRTSIRVPGVEFSGRLHSNNNLEIALQHTILSARVQENGSYSRPAEDRPDYLSLAEAGWNPFAGPGAHLEAVVTGPRWSSDATDPIDGLRRLPAGLIWNLRLSYPWNLSHFLVGQETKIELHVRLNNIFDQQVNYQTGLPGPGRMVSFGASAGF